MSIDPILDAQYRVAPSVDALMAARKRAAQLSDDVRLRLDTRLNVQIGATADEYVDVYFPRRRDLPPTLRRGRERSPVFVFFHGGFWRALSARDYGFVALGPAAHGFITVSVNYSLAPQATLETIVSQCRGAMRWVIEHVASHGGDPGRLIIGGHSAGAHLAAMCLLDDSAGRSARATVAGALLVSGLYDLAPLRHTFVQEALDLSEERARHLSPVYASSDLSVPTLLAVGERESAAFHGQSAMLAAKLAESGTACESMRVAEADHFAALEPLLDPESRYCAWMAERIGTI